MSSPGVTFNLTCGKGVTELQNLTNLCLSSFAESPQMQQKSFDVSLNGHGKVPQQNVIGHLECHLLSNILIVCWHTSFLAVLIVSSGNSLRVNFHEGCRKLPLSETVIGEF